MEMLRNGSNVFPFFLEMLLKSVSLRNVDVTPDKRWFAQVSWPGYFVNDFAVIATSIKFILSGVHHQAVLKKFPDISRWATEVLSVGGAVVLSASLRVVTKIFSCASIQAAISSTIF